MDEKKEITVDEQKKIQLMILKAVDKFCCENNITYYLTAGTLIGALRHKGFIPWDDDIDLVMLRPDYEKFVHSFGGKDFEPYAVMYGGQRKDYAFSYAKIYDDRTIYYEGEVNMGGIGVNVDLFPLDSATDTYDGAKNLLANCERFTKLLGFKSIVKEKRRVWYKSFTIRMTQFFLKPFSYQFLINKIDKRARQDEQNTESKYVVNAVIHAKGEREILEREWFKGTVDVEFEGELFKAPVGSHEYLTRLFGDYMKLPPEEQRITHHYNRAYYR